MHPEMEEVKKAYEEVYGPGSWWKHRRNYYMSGIQKGFIVGYEARKMTELEESENDIQ